MEKIPFDNGMKSYRLGDCGVLRFNPGDPNLYARFLEAADKIRDMEKSLAGGGEELLQKLAQADKQMKELLGWVFGPGNDFHQLLQGVSLLAVAGNGRRVVDNLFEALQPILLQGAEECARERTQEAVAKAKERRAAQ